MSQNSSTINSKSQSQTPSSSDASPPRDAQEVALGRFGWLLGGIIALFLVVLAAFNAAVDPFAIFGSPRLAGFNADKPQIELHRRLHKPHRLADVDVDVVILGSSRAENGIDPEHPVLRQRGAAYNAGLTDANMYEVRRMAEHALAVQELELLVVGLDFFQFVADSAAKPGFNEARLAVSADGSSQYFHRMADVGTALWSWSGTEASYKTIAGDVQQDQPKAKWERYLVDGLDDGVDDYVQTHGQRGAFLTKEMGEILTRWPQYLGTPEEYAQRREAAVYELRQLLYAAAEARVPLWIYCSPVHARMNELVIGLGLGGHFHAWREDLAAVVSGVASKYPDWDIRCWDFSGYNGVTTEVVPRGREPAMRFYWEDSHFKPEVGGWIMQRLAGQKQGAWPADFGRDLLQLGVPAWLAAEHDRRAAWQQAQPLQVAEVELVKQFLFEHSTSKEAVAAAFLRPNDVLAPWIDARLPEALKP